MQRYAGDPNGLRVLMAGVANSANYSAEQRDAAQAWLRSHNG